MGAGGGLCPPPSYIVKKCSDVFRSKTMIGSYILYTLSVCSRGI